MGLPEGLHRISYSLETECFYLNDFLNQSYYSHPR